VKTLAGEVNASISGLEGLNASLGQTLPMLDRLVAENEATVAQTTQKIELALDSCTARANSAYQRYQDALAELDCAERNECASEYHYSAVYSAEAEYNRLIQNCTRIKAIYSEYTTRTAAYKKSLSADFEDYSTLLKKSDSFLSRYAELLQRSQKAIGGEADGDNYQKPSALYNIMTAGVSGLQSPSALAQAIGALRAPPGAEDSYAQTLQAAVNTLVVGSKELMEGTIRQHGKSPAAKLQDMQILQAIDVGVKASGRTEPLNEPLKDDEDIIDGETGVNLTDEKLRESTTSP
jgi:hypothetical protein